MKFDVGENVSFIAFMIIVFVAIGIGAAFDSCNDRAIAVECVKAGKTWSRAEGCK